MTEFSSHREIYQCHTSICNVDLKVKMHLLFFLVKNIWHY